MLISRDHLEQGANMTVTAKRRAGLRQMLADRRRELQDEVQARIRDGRAGRTNIPRDALELADDDSQGEMELRLLQMRAETLTRIDQALARLDTDQYGSCLECDEDIAERRLRALPFAVRCQPCEEKRETAAGVARQQARQRGAPVLFPDLAGS
jgi:DnaK suppressor protein